MRKEIIMEINPCIWLKTETTLPDEIAISIDAFN